MDLQKLYKSATALVFIAGLGWGTYAFLDRYALADDVDKRFQQYDLQLAMDRQQIYDLYQRQIEAMVQRIALLRAKANKTADDLAYLRYLEEELRRLKANARRAQ